MFLNSDTIKKRTILFDEGNEYFRDDAEIFSFEDITAFFHQETAQMTNGVYEGTRLLFTLIFKNRVKPYIIEIDSNKEAKYKLIYTLSNSIAHFRAKEILENVESGKMLLFQTLRDVKLVYENGMLELHYTNKKSHHEPLFVTKVQLKKNLLIFENKDGDEEALYANTISDIATFLQLIVTKPFFSDLTDEINKRDAKLYVVLISAILILGLNGYFELCCMQNKFVDMASTLSMLLLWILLIVSPFYWVIGKSNAKKVDKERHSIVAKGAHNGEL